MDGSGGRYKLLAFNFKHLAIINLKSINMSWYDFFIMIFNSHVY